MSAKTFRLLVSLLSLVTFCMKLVLIIAVFILRSRNYKREKNNLTRAQQNPLQKIV